MKTQFRMKTGNKLMYVCICVFGLGEDPIFLEKTIEWKEE